MASSTYKHSTILKARIRAALQNGLIGDALSMPVHWFYNPRDITRIFGARGITKFEAAPPTHPSSIMNLHSTQSGGRWSAGGSARVEGPSIVGDVILKGRKHHWTVPNTHYHHGMQAGDNTLNADCARLTTRLLATSKLSYSTDSFLDAYIEFMQDEASYKDTYAESFHRGFFHNLIILRKPRDQCGQSNHDTPSIGAFVMLVPIVLAELLRDPDLPRVQQIARAHLQLTHPDPKLALYCDEFVSLVAKLLLRTETDEHARDCFEDTFARLTNGSSLTDLVKRTRDDSEIVGAMFSTACYITGSLPAAVYLAYKYSGEESPLTGLLANTNLGGENAHRGYVVGVLLGLATAKSHSDLFSQLSSFPAVEKEIEALLAASE